MYKKISITSVAFLLLFLAACGGSDDSNNGIGSNVFIILGMAEVPSSYDTLTEFSVTFDTDESFSATDGDMELTAKNGTVSPKTTNILNFDIWMSEYNGELSRWERVRTLNSDNISTQGNNIVFSFPKSYVPNLKQSTPIAVATSRDNNLADTIVYSSNSYGIETPDSFDPPGGKNPSVDLQSFTIDDSFDFADDPAPGNTGGGTTATGIYAICLTATENGALSASEGCHQYYTKGDLLCSDAAGTVCTNTSREDLCIKTGQKVGIPFIYWSSGWGTFDNEQSCTDTCGRDSVVNFGGTCYGMVIR